MIVQFEKAATVADRAAVEATLREMKIGLTKGTDVLLLEDVLDPEPAIQIASMPGVAEIRPGRAGLATIGDVFISWVAAGAGVMGILIVLAAQFPAKLGLPVDPTRTPPDLKPTWPVLPWFAAFEHLPAWLPVSALPALFVLALFFWPFLVRGFAAKRPALHTAIGVIVIAGLLSLGVVAVLK